MKTLTVEADKVPNFEHKGTLTSLSVQVVVTKRHNEFTIECILKILL